MIQLSIILIIIGVIGCLTNGMYMEVTKKYTKLRLYWISYLVFITGGIMWMIIK